MNFKTGLTRKLASAFLILCVPLLAFGAQDYSRQDVDKILKAIEKVERETARGTKRSLEKISVDESELNSYIAYRIEEENERFLKELRVKLFKKNKIEGKILVDLRGENIPKFLRPQMTLYFGGKLEVKDGMVKLVLKDLFLENQRIDPNVLDFVIALTAKIEKYEIWSINDWYELPYGIKDIETQNHKAIFFY
ncbi:MAG: hypothetical protein KAU47_02150 [Candidatus Aminicenantes bacterium]|nr:hypothetical protein [Candidatus Aminicenantes bacterium]